MARKSARASSKKKAVAKTVPVQETEQELRPVVSQTTEETISAALPETPVTNDQAAVVAQKAQELVDSVQNAADSVEQKSSRKKAVVLSIVGVIVLLIAGIVTYFVMSKPAQKTPQDIVSEVGKTVLLPSDETPSVALVSDVTKLPKVPLFINAQNGDRVLIYERAKRAYLYRPSLHKLIAMSDVNIQAPTSTPNPNTTLTPSVTTAPVTVVIYNGTNTAGLAKSSQKTLLSKDKAISVTGTGDTKKKEYAKTIVIDLSGKNAAEAKTIAGIVNGTVTTLPSTETKPASADILVIIGTDNVSK